MIFFSPARRLRWVLPPVPERRLLQQRLWEVQDQDQGGGRVGERLLGGLGLDTAAAEQVRKPRKWKILLFFLKNNSLFITHLLNKICFVIFFIKNVVAFWRKKTWFNFFGGKSFIFRSRQARKIERRLLLSAGAEVAAIPEEEGEMMEEGEDDVMMRPRAR